MGCDADSRPLRIAVEVSIHAPTWGATDSHPSLAFSGVFQSTHPRGVRHCLRFTVMRLGLFQSTHPRGVRHTGKRRRFRTLCFNPRTHVGCDRNEQNSPHVYLTSFNPRTHVGCDIEKYCTIIIDGLFQSTHPRGVRLFCVVSVLSKT